MIRRIKVLGYKSLKDLALDLGPVRILIGPNAAGKSNVIDVLRVLAGAARSDIETAVRRRGGVDTVAFLGSEQKAFESVLDYFVPDPGAPRSRSDMRYRLKVAERDRRAGLAEEELQIKRNRNEPGAPKLWVRAEWGKGAALRDPAQATREPFDTGDPGVLALRALGFLEAYPRIRALRTFIEGWQFLATDLARVREPHRECPGGHAPAAPGPAEAREVDAGLQAGRALAHAPAGRGATMSPESGAETPWTIVLIVEDDSDGRVLQELLRPLAIPVRLDWLPANGIGNIRRSGRRLIDLARDRVGRRGCVAVLIDRDGRDAARQEPHKSIARACRASGVPLILARESLEAWMLADPGISRWLGVPAKGQTDTLRNPKALVARAFYRAAGRDDARRRGRLQVARQARGIRRQTSASFDAALRHVEGCLGRGRHRVGGT